MAEKWNARVQNKRDTSANWTNSDPVLLNGEVIVVDTASGETRKKIGDGVRTYKQLPFDDEGMRGLVNSKTAAVISNSEPSSLNTGDYWDKIV